VDYSSASGRIIGAKDHASIQINIAEVRRMHYIILWWFYRLVRQQLATWKFEWWFSLPWGWQEYNAPNPNV